MTKYVREFESKIKAAPVVAVGTAAAAGIATTLIANKLIKAKKRGKW